MDITCVEVYGIFESATASGYPMSTTIEDNTYFNADDMKRLTKLGNNKVGTGHDTALRGCIVQGNLSCSQNMHRQILRYNFFDIVSSQSLMHRVLKMDISKQCNEYVNETVVSCVNALISNYNEAVKDGAYDTEMLKRLYLEILYSIPMGFELTFRFSTNYLQLKTIYNQRKTHR